MPTPTLHDPELCQALLRPPRRHPRPPHAFYGSLRNPYRIHLQRRPAHAPSRAGHPPHGAGCPVCVTHDREVAAFLKLAEQPNVIIATFGDLMRVPGPDGRSLKHAQADGARVSVIYSPLDALTLAADNPDATVVFLGRRLRNHRPGRSQRPFSPPNSASWTTSPFSPATSSCLRRLPPCSAIPTTASTRSCCRGMYPRSSAFRRSASWPKTGSAPPSSPGSMPADILDAPLPHGPPVP